MRLTRQIDFSDVEGLTRLLKAGKASMERFSLEIPLEEAEKGLYSAIRSVIELDKRSLRINDATKSEIRQVAEWLTNPDAKQGLMLCGLYGNGKTTMAKALGRLIGYVTEIEYGYRDRKIMYLITAKEICRVFLSDMAAYRKLFTEEMLVIDDFGQEPPEVLSYGMPQTPIIDLICERYEKRLMTIVTTNLEAKQIEERYGPRIRDRFREMLQSVIFTNESFR